MFDYACNPMGINGYSPADTETHLTHVKRKFPFFEGCRYVAVTLRLDNHLDREKLDYGMISRSLMDSLAAKVAHHTANRITLLIDRQANAFDSSVALASRCVSHAGYYSRDAVPSSYVSASQHLRIHHWDCRVDYLPSLQDFCQICYGHEIDFARAAVKPNNTTRVDEVNTSRRVFARITIPNTPISTPKGERLVDSVKIHELTNTGIYGVDLSGNLRDVPDKKYDGSLYNIVTESTFAVPFFQQHKR